MLEPHLSDPDRTELIDTCLASVLALPPDPGQERDGIGSDALHKEVRVGRGELPCWRGTAGWRGFVRSERCPRAPPLAARAAPRLQPGRGKGCLQFSWAPRGKRAAPFPLLSYLLKRPGPSAH